MIASNINTAKSKVWPRKLYYSQKCFFFIWLRVCLSHRLIETKKPLNSPTTHPKYRELLSFSTSPMPKFTKPEIQQKTGLARFNWFFIVVIPFWYYFLEK